MAKTTPTTETKKVETVSAVIIAPRVTEKASQQSTDNAYTFIVAPSATKLAIAAEIKKMYKVTPLSVKITKIPPQKTFIRGNWGMKAGMKKAIVFLKKGDTIAFS